MPKPTTYLTMELQRTSAQPLHTPIPPCRRLTRLARHVASFMLAGGVLWAAACAGSDSTPTAPSIVAASGTWRGTVVVTAVTGDECAGALQYLVGSSFPYTLTLQQNGTSVTGKVETGGRTCDIAGNADSDGMSLAGSACTSIAIDVTSCQGNVREMSLQMITIAMTIGRGHWFADDRRTPMSPTSTGETDG
jgi:hypothetical protein